MSLLFKPLSRNDEQFLLASHMPQGKLFEQIFDVDDDFGKLLLALATEFVRAQVIKDSLFDEMDITKTNELLENWEESVAIPDDCFTTNISLSQRKNQVLQKFSKYGGVQLSGDFIRVALSFGFVVEIKTGSKRGTFPLEFPTPFFLDTKSARHAFFIILVQSPIDEEDVNFSIPFPYIFGDFVDAVESEGFPIPFPFSFNKGNKEFLQCIFDKLAPANVKVILKNVGEI